MNLYVKPKYCKKATVALLGYVGIIGAAVLGIMDVCVRTGVDAGAAAEANGLAVALNKKYGEAEAAELVSKVNNAIQEG